jgi:hypothetical protein
VARDRATIRERRLSEPPAATHRNRLHAGANEDDYLHKTGMPNGGRLQMWSAVGLSGQTQHADSSYGIQRYGIME